MQRRQGWLWLERLKETQEGRSGVIVGKQRVRGGGSGFSLEVTVPADLKEGIPVTVGLRRKQSCDLGPEVSSELEGRMGGREEDNIDGGSQ